MEDKFLNIDEVSKYLNIPKSTIYKLSQKNKIPSCKIGKQLRFRKSSLDRWVGEKEVGVTGQTDVTSALIKENKVAGLKPRHILLIDDDTLVLKTVSKFLQSHGHDVTTAKNGEEALGKVGNLNFDLIIADIKMPGIDGIETIRRIRELSENYNKPRIPEILITGYIDTEAERRAEKLGITDYVYKPFATTDFIDKVKKRLGFNADLN
ncbi:response regulator [Patescibacteria group bacterium]|nr:response regulator [Patescibacteria group bacterium]